MILLLQSKGEGREKANAPWPRFPDPGRLELFGELFRLGDSETRRRLRASASKRNLPARTGSSGSGSAGYRFRAGALARVSTEMGVPRKPNRRRSWFTR